MTMVRGKGVRGGESCISPPPPNYPITIIMELSQLCFYCVLGWGCNKWHPPPQKTFPWLVTHDPLPRSTGHLFSQLPSPYACHSPLLLPPQAPQFCILQVIN